VVNGSTIHLVKSATNRAVEQASTSPATSSTGLAGPRTASALSGGALGGLGGLGGLMDEESLQRLMESPLMQVCCGLCSHQRIGDAVLCNFSTIDVVN
jgi:hypothetical protein